jgi:preprotein translocase SecE subunit
MASVTKREDEKAPKGEAGSAGAPPAGGNDAVDPADRERADLPAKVGYATPAAKAAPAGPGFFTVYKKGQGYWTRMGTAVGAGLIGALITWQIYAQVPAFFADTARGRRVGLIAAAIFAAVYAFIAWRLMNKPANVDFLIATDSEMKKVNWTSRRELIGSTKVVILFMFGIAVILFVLDLLFNTLFYGIRVLEVPWWKQVFGME